MHSTYDMLRERREEILALATRHGVTRLRVFGSVAREEERPDSDIDMLIATEDGLSLLDVAVFQTDLEELLQKRIDIVSERAIYPLLREEILNNAKEF